MIRFLLMLFLVGFVSCNITRIKDESYAVSNTAPELGSIGFSELGGIRSTKFEVRSIPKLESPIRLSIEVVPFSKRLHNIYKSKSKYNQDQSQVAFVDSLPRKPELVTIRVLDVMKLVSEINGEHNQELFRFLKDTKDSQVVTGITSYFSQDDLVKIKQSDAYYISHYQDSKYAISLYKLGKKTDVLFVNSLNILAYKASKFCWGVTESGKWYVSDIINLNSSCKGKTEKQIVEKKHENNLFDL